MTLRRIAAACAVIPALAVLAPSSARAQVTGFQEYFVPVREDQLQDVYDDMNSDNNNDHSDEFMHTVITVTAGADGTRVYYDHWEDGYDFNVNAPGTSADESYVLNAGESRVFQSANIPTRPRGTSTFYDGGDRVFTAGRVTTVTKAGWCEPVGTVAAYAWEVYPIAAQNTSYVVPVGEAYAAAPKDFDDFQRLYVLVMSLEDNNVVTINDPNVGGTEFTDNDMDRGEVNTTLLRSQGPARVTGTKKLQTVFFGGLQPSSYNRHTLNVPPIALFGSDYVSPVPGFAGGEDTDLFVYNPNGFPVDIVVEDDLGTGAFTVAAGDTVSYSGSMGRFVPPDSPVRLTNLNGDPFWAFGVGDTEATGYDWTFNLVQVPLLQETNNIGWAPGSRTPGPTSNGSPLFISPADDGTYVFIDFSPIDGVDDQVFRLNRGDTIKVYDPDGDNTGTRVQSIGKVAVTFGEDPSVAGIGDPFLDLGYSHPPFLESWIDSVLGIAHSGSPTTLPSSGGITTITLSANTFTNYAVNGVDLQDVLPTGWSYVPGSTIVTLPGGAPAPGADPSIVGQTLTWDLSANMIANRTLTVQFQAQTTGATQFGVNRFLGRATGTIGAGANLMTFSPEQPLFVTVTPPPTVLKTLYLQADGADAGTTPDLDRILPMGGAPTVTAVNNGTTATWELTPALALPLGIPETLTASLFLDPVTGTSPPDVTVALRSGTTLLGLATLNDLNSGVQQYDFSISPLAASLSAGSTIRLEVTVANAGAGGRVDVYFASAANRSRIDIPTFSFIRVTGVSTFDAAHPGGVAKSVFQQGETVSVRATVTDPFGSYDITSTSSVLQRNGSTIANPPPGTVSTNASSITVEVLRADQTPGNYTLDVTALEGTEGTVSHTAQGAWTVVDDDRDDDGLTNNFEVANGLDPDDADTDNDLIQDGTELGRNTPQGFGTDLGVFIPDLDTATTTLPLDNDTDNDLILDGTEDANRNGRLDAGETNPNLADTDGDGISDGVEDADRDGVVDAGETNPLNTDSDGDLINDGIEDADKDGVVDGGETNPRTTDSDSDGIADGIEDANQNGIVNLGETFPTDDDTDDDGLLDGNEDLDDDRTLDPIASGETDPLVFDTDGDGLGDGLERGRATGQGTGTAMPPFVPDADTATTTNPRLADTDADGIFDGTEDVNQNGARTATETDPNDDDSDDDGLLDGNEDLDDDHVLDPIASGETDPLVFDTDGDQLGDGLERGRATGEGTGTATPPFVADADPASTTNPRLADTDADGIADGIEDVNGNGAVVATETNPNDDDTDDDGLLDGNEDLDDDHVLDPIASGETDPLVFDTDADGLGDGLERGRATGQGTGTAAPPFIADADPASTTNPRLADTDADGIDDGTEDVDGNGARVAIETDPNDDDTDDDGLLDGNEDLDDDHVLGTIASGETDPLVFDTDADGLGDGLERGRAAGQGTGTAAPPFVADADPLTTTNPRLPDTDADGIADGTEDVNQNGARVATETNPNDDDTDDDGLLDGNEDLDDDHVLDPIASGETDPLSFDTDGDQLGDGLERGRATGQGTGTAAPPFVADSDPASTTNPRIADTDGDLVGDGAEDRDKDGARDADEWDPNDGDTDDDLLSDGTEDANRDGTRQANETDPLDTDTDNDLLTDGTESTGANPTNPFDDDSDDDGILDGNEDADQDGALDAGETNPNAFDTDGDTLSDGKEIGLAAPQGLNTGAAFQPDTHPSSTTSAVDDDSDDDGLMDGNEDADRDGFRDANETDPNDLDTDDDFLQDGLELGLIAAQGDDTNGGVFTPDTNPATQTLPLDDDTDDDGLLDGNEDANRNGNREPSETRATTFDTDADGLGDGQELGLTAPQGGDTDLADFVADTDGATTTLPLDDDSDDDGREDGSEDANGDGAVGMLETDPNEFDTDGDGLGDGLEVGLTAPEGTGTGGLFEPDTQPSSTTDPLDDDTDDDGLTDGNEDLDGDGFKDAFETSPGALDTDGDLLSDGLELGLTTPQGSDTGVAFTPDADDTTTTDPLVVDTDTDGIGDGVEDVNRDGARVVTETDPLDDDTDDDGLLDGNEDLDDDHVLDAGETDPLDFDTDNDLLSDGLELGLAAPQGGGTNPGFFDADTDTGSTTNPRDADTDNDGRRDGSEDADSDGFVDAATETDPNIPDTDGDGLSDGLEAGLATGEGGADSGSFAGDTHPASTTNPLDDDTDDDGLLDGTEDANANGAVGATESDPNMRDTDADGVQDGVEAGLATPEGGDTDPGFFLADSDGTTTTNPADDDTDDDGFLDGNEDDDGDGFVDAIETDPNDPDTDGDGVQDGTESGLTAPEGSDTGAGFTPDADGGTVTTNPLDADSDDDLIVDGLEDTDLDGEYDVGPETNPNDVDTDGDLVDDGVEDANQDGDVDPGETDPRIADSDDDGIADGVELGGPVFTNPNDDDTDNDGILDGNEDADRDGVLDPGETSAASNDTDGDGVLDGVEIGLTAPQGSDTTGFVADADPASTTNPTVADTDGDGLPDGVEDANKNGATGTTETDPDDADSDDDLVSDGAEVLGVLGTAALDDDTDDDGVIDGNEDLDRDGAPDAGESSPTNADTDGDGLSDGIELGLSAPQGSDTIGFVADADGTSQTSMLDDDSDDDGILDGNEDADQDGATAVGETAPNAADSDNDGVEDGVELGLTAPQGVGTVGFIADADPATSTDPLDGDSDDDGLLDGSEDGDGNGAVASQESDPLSVDSDGDGVLDGTEVGLTAPQSLADTDLGTFVGDSDPATTTSPIDDDTDDDGVLDGTEDANHDGARVATELDPLAPDTDGDGLFDGTEIALASPQGSDTNPALFRADADTSTETDPLDDDTDDDGLMDGNEDADRNGIRIATESDPLLFDTDADELGDGLEMGLDAAQGQDTLASAFTPDSDPGTTTSPLLADTDGGGMPDGEEDLDKDGDRDSLERNPLDGRDDTDPLVSGSGCSCSLDANASSSGPATGAVMLGSLALLGGFVIRRRRESKGAL